MVEQEYNIRGKSTLSQIFFAVQENYYSFQIMETIFKTYIRNTLKSGNLLFQGDTKQIAEALQAGFIKQAITSESYTINIASDIFINAVIAVAEEDIKEPFPRNIAESIAFISRYEAWLKSSFNNNAHNAFGFLIEPFKIYSLVKLHNGRDVDLITFYDDYNNEDKNSDTELWRFDEYFFHALPYLDIDEVVILQILTSTNKTKREQHDNNEKIEFVIKFAEINYDHALRLYKYGKSNGLEKQANLLALLLAGLYNSGFEDAVNEARTLFETNQSVAIIFFGAINNQSSELIDYIIDLSDKINKDTVDTVRHYSFTLQKLLQLTVTEKQIERIFQLYFELLALQNKDITNNISGTLSWYILGYEKERYDLLKAALNHKYIEGHIIENYFNNFKNPQFFFEFFTTNYSALRGRINVKLFEEGFDHFINSNYSETEPEVFNLISHEDIHLRTGILKLLISSRIRTKQLNLLLLDSEIKQLRAIEAMVAFPFGINELMPSLLILRNSSHVNVVNYLKKSLWILVFEAYHEYAYNLIEKNLENNKADKAFLKSIKQSIDAYEQMRKAKNSIKDLDPWANERSHVQLYYKLEREKTAKSMNEIHNDENSFLRNTAKTVQIVRGGAWKIEGHDVSQLGSFETSIPVDLRMYKNTDQYELNLNFPKSKF